MALEIINTPKILTFMGLNEEQQTQVLAEATEKSIFAGQAAVNLGLITQTRLDDSLLVQSQKKVNAAAADIGTIRLEGTQQAPADFKAHWGNRGINKASETPSISESLSALAQMSENMVVLANGKPEIAAELAPAVSAARQLTSSIALGTPALTSEQANELYNRVTDGLRTAVTQSQIPLRDEEGNFVNLEPFIDERSKEVKAGIANMISRTVTGPTPVTPETPAASGTNAAAPILTDTTTSAPPDQPTPPAPGPISQQILDSRQQPPSEGQGPAV